MSQMMQPCWTCGYQNMHIFFQYFYVGPPKICEDHPTYQLGGLLGDPGFFISCSTDSSLEMEGRGIEGWNFFWFNPYLNFVPHIPLCWLNNFIFLCFWKLPSMVVLIVNSPGQTQMVPGNDQSICFFFIQNIYCLSKNPMETTSHDHKSRQTSIPPPPPPPQYDCHQLFFWSIQSINCLD